MSTKIFTFGGHELRTFNSGVSYTGGTPFNASPSAGSVSFVSGDPPTITDSSPDFIAYGFVPGDIMLVEGSQYNDGLYHIVGVTADTLTLDKIHTLVDETPSNAVILHVLPVAAIRGVGSDHYGEIYAYENTVNISLAQQDVWYQVNIFGHNGASYGIHADYSNNHLVIHDDGRYRIEARFTVSSAYVNQYRFNVFVANTDTGIANLGALFKTIADIDDAKSVCLLGITDLYVDDIIELRAMRLDGGGTSRDVLIRDVGLRISQIW